MLTALVRDLNLGQNRLGDVGVAQIADQPAAAGLQVLRLDANGLTDAGLEALARSPHLTRLTTLDVSSNPIGDAGFRALLESKSLRHLRHLVFTELHRIGPGWGTSWGSDTIAGCPRRGERCAGEPTTPVVG